MRKKTELRDAVERLHKCRAKLVGLAAVRETYRGNVVWEGDVSEFALAGHPSAETCYAWAEPDQRTAAQRIFAVLKIPPIDSPAAAVRASIVADAKAARGE